MEDWRFVFIAGMFFGVFMCNAINFALWLLQSKVNEQQSNDDGPNNRKYHGH